MFRIGKTKGSGEARLSAIHGVNLGGWLLLEKWITPSVFKGSTAADEYSLCESASSEQKLAIEKFRQEFISLSDFRWLKDHGVTAVRLPVGYGMFGDAPPYLATVQYVDAAFEWAFQTGIKILLDVHAVPGSQNGKQESGHIGAVSWHTSQRNIVQSLQFIEKLAKRYGNREVLLGIELLNEPSSIIPRRTLHEYYEAAYKIIRKECRNGIWVVYSDIFRPRRWRRFMKNKRYTDVYIDSHQYQLFTRRDQRRSIHGHLSRTIGAVSRQIRAMQKFHPAIIGEWSLALHPDSLTGLNQNQMAAARSTYGSVQRLVYEDAAAWFYWTYKTEDQGPWNFRASLEQGWLAPL